MFLFEKTGMKKQNKKLIPLIQLGRMSVVFLFACLFALLLFFFRLGVVWTQGPHGV
jgi:hypothetical protein